MAEGEGFGRLLPIENTEVANFLSLRICSKSVEWAIFGTWLVHRKPHYQCQLRTFKMLFQSYSQRLKRLSCMCFAATFDGCAQAR